MILIHASAPFQIGADEGPWATSRTKPLCRHGPPSSEERPESWAVFQASVAPPRRALPLRLRTHSDAPVHLRPATGAHTRGPYAWDREDRRPGSAATGLTNGFRCMVVAGGGNVDP